MLEIRFGVVEHYTENRGIVSEAREVGNQIIFKLTAEQLSFWAKQALKANKPVEFTITQGKW